MFVPDLQDGIIVNGWSGANRWQTDIEAVLSRNNTQWAYLSTSCAGEAVGEGRIFKGPYEFALIHTWDGTLIFRWGATIHPIMPWKRLAPFERFPEDSVIQCETRDAKELGFDEVLNELQSEPQGRDNHLFMRIAWREHELFCRCRYINFPNPAADEAYLQPILGPVLYHDDRFWISYVAAHITTSGTAVVQFNNIATVDFFCGRRFDGSGWGSKVLRALSFGILRTDAYCRVVDVPAKCTFFRYK